MQKLKEFRERNGLTQSELAEQAGLSLRTIQRIETGQSIPKGHTLQVLSDLIDISPSEFSDSASQVSNSQIDKLKLINISALSFIIFPFGNIIFPFILWNKNKTDQIVYRKGKYILNFQIIWSLILSLMLIISPFIQNSLQLSFSLIIAVLILGYSFNVLTIFIFSRRINKAEFERLKVTSQLF